MNQTFKKKAIAASLATAFVVVGTGISAAQANQFADTSLTLAVSAGVNVPVSSTAVLTGQKIVITETVGGAITAGNILLTLTNGAKWKGQGAMVVTDTKVSDGSDGTMVITGGTATGLGGDSATATVAVGTAGSTGVAQAITLTGMTIDTSAMSAGQTVSVSVSSSSTATGLTTGVSATLANVAAAGVTVTADATTVPTVPKLGATAIANSITVAEVIMGSLIDKSATDEITITLPSGYSYSTTPSTTFTTLAGSVTSFTGNVAKIDVSNSATASAGKVVVAMGDIFVPSTATDGNVDATVAVKLTDGTTKTTTVTLFKVVAGSTSNLAYTTGTTTAPTTYAALYAGRTGQSTGVDVAVKEVVGSTLLGGGTVLLTLPTGVTAGKDYTTTEVTVSGGVGAVSTVTDSAGTTSEDGKSTIMLTLGSDTSSATGKATFKLDDLDLSDSAVVGDLNVTIGGSAQATAGTVKVATVIRATDASVSGTVSTVTAGSSLSLPDVVITESKAGALTTAGGGMGLYIANANGVNLTTTDATVKAYTASGTDVSSTIFGSTSGATITSTAAPGQLGFVLTAASTSSTGPVTIKISGVKATVLSTAVAGDVTAVVGGMSTVGSDTTPTSGEGATAFKQTVTVGKVVSAIQPTYPAAAVTGSSITSQNITVGLVPAGNDQGSQGSIFVAAVIPAPSAYAGVYFMNSSKAWSLFKDCASAPAYFTGALTTTSGVDLLPAASDLTALKTTDIYVGYGKGGALSPAGTACTNMLNAGNYSLVYTIK